MYPIIEETDPALYVTSVFKLHVRYILTLYTNVKTRRPRGSMSNFSLPLPSFKSLDTSKLDDAMKQFINHYFIFLSIILVPSVPEKDRESIWRAVPEGTGYGFKRKRMMRRGERKRQEDLGSTLDDADHTDDKALDAILGPSGMDPTDMIQDNGDPWWYEGPSAHQAPSTDYYGEAPSTNHDSAVPAGDDFEGADYYQPMGEDTISTFEARPGSDS
jgi:hypothetical protein